jgi:hypothetical protein
MIISTVFVTMFATLAPATVYAASAKDAVCEGAQMTTSAVACSSTSGDSVKKVIKLAIQIFQMIVGIIAVFMLITAGLGYVTSGGDGAKTKSAKDRILYSAIGLVVVVLAQIIVSFVLNRTQGALDAP